MSMFKYGTGVPIPLLDFAPDLAIDTPGIILDAVGAFPSSSGYRPLQNLIPIGEALPGRPLGTFYAYYGDTTIALLAAVQGDPNVDFYHLNSATREWEED